MLDLVVTLDSGERVGAGGPVRLRLDDADPSNAVFACERATLQATLESSAGGDERLARLGDLDLGDDELEHLLAEAPGLGQLGDRRSAPSAPGIALQAAPAG